MGVRRKDIPGSERFPPLGPGAGVGGPTSLHSGPKAVGTPPQSEDWIGTPALPAVWSWASNSASLRCSVFCCKTGLVTGSTS